MLLVGDWAPGRKTVVLPQQVNGVLGNLEGPVLPEGHGCLAAAKAGPSLCSQVLPEPRHRFVFSLANNHLMDYGASGLDATRQELHHRRFQACGAGSDVADARRAAIVDDGGVRVGIIACCEAQFGVARRQAAGVAEIGPWVYRAIEELRRSVDAVIVSAHAAVEDSPWPPPFVRDLYRSFVDAGATVVHGHHAHVPQGYEAHGDGVIFYGMGNYAVDADQWRDYPNGMWSLTAEIDVARRPVTWRLATSEIRHQVDSDTIALGDSNDDERAAHARYLEICNRPLREPELFEALWQEVAMRAFHHYGAQYMRFAATSPSVRRRQAMLIWSTLKDLLRRRASPSPSRFDYLLWHTMIACESHRQMLATALGVLGGEIADIRTAETRQLADEMMPWSRGVEPA